MEVFLIFSYFKTGTSDKLPHIGFSTHLSFDFQEMLLHAGPSEMRADI